MGWFRSLSRNWFANIPFRGKIARREHKRFSSQKKE
jgi:hypothetical protein